MGRVEYGPLQIGLATAADFNAITAAVAAETGNVDGENWAEEGLDERVFEDDIVSEVAFTKVIHDAVATQGPLGVAFVTFNPGAVLFRTGAFTTGPNERTRVRWKHDFVSNATQDGVPLGGAVEVQLAYSVAAVVTTIPSTLRRMEPFTALASRLALDLGQPFRVSCTGFLPASTSFDWVEVQIRDAGAGVTVQLGRGTLIGRTFKRIA